MEAFTNWLADGGITHGESDHWRYKPADLSNPTRVSDIHVPIRHQLGIDHVQPTFRKDSIDRRFTDVHGHVNTEIPT